MENQSPAIENQDTSCAERTDGFTAAEEILPLPLDSFKYVGGAQGIVLL
jgi:hypothetical protein